MEFQWPHLGPSIPALCQIPNDSLNPVRAQSPPWLPAAEAAARRHRWRGAPWERRGGADGGCWAPEGQPVIGK